LATGGSRPPLRSAAGVSPSAPTIIAYDLRGGIVVDVGLPGFASHLAHDVDAKEFVGQTWTVLTR
jgi:hypothetical protein